VKLTLVKSTNQAASDIHWKMVPRGGSGVQIQSAPPGQRTSADYQSDFGNFSLLVAVLGYSEGAPQHRSGSGLPYGKSCQEE
jgi:hypothetical protein